MTFEEMIFRLAELSLASLGMFLMYRVAILALNNKKGE